MREKLKQLEAIARRLEPGAADRQSWMNAAGAYSESFLEALPELPVFVEDDGSGLGFEARINDQPTGMPELLDILAEAIDRPGINPASGGHMGYIPGGGIYPSSIGDYLACVTNRYSGVMFASPGAARMEQSLVEWMRDLVGYPQTAGGDLTSGGSTANLAAIVTARDACDISSKDASDSCIYMTRQAHHCVDKALRVAGLDNAHKRYIPMDAVHRMNSTELRGMIQADKAQGLRPFLVVGSAGTTDTGAVDPLVEIANIAAANEMWFHIDAAYGGFFLLCEEGREVLQGIGLADSIVMDPHKGLFLPYGSGAVLVKDARKLARAHSYQADYMQDAHRPGDPWSPAELSVELSRPFRGLRLWLPLKLLGLDPFRAALEEKLYLARYFRQELKKLSGWVTGPSPDLSVVTYRYVTGNDDADAINRRILEAVHADGKVFITSTLINEHYTLRLAVLNFRTHLEHIDYLLNLLDKTARALDVE